MTRLFLTLSVIAFAITGNHCYSQEAETDTVIQGKLLFEETIHDFGQIKHNGNGTYDFVFKNTGEVAVTLENVRSSCGCTIPTWPREPILPGKQGIIKVKYDTKRTGTFSKTITVYANAVGSPYKLHIKGTVNPSTDNE